MKANMASLFAFEVVAAAGKISKGSDESLARDVASVVHRLAVDDGVHVRLAWHRAWVACLQPWPVVDKGTRRLQDGTFARAVSFLEGSFGGCTDTSRTETSSFVPGSLVGRLCISVRLCSSGPRENRLHVGCPTLGTEVAVAKVGLHVGKGRFGGWKDGDLVLLFSIVVATLSFGDDSIQVNWRVEGVESGSLRDI